ncbi:spore coat protein [Bacillus kexueae]|uniref:spore coat protein n=1 Tax=Aeribacillus kexueae TaxID=2078952 RepID=UPI001FAFB5E9|nr:spore coat protein [Bacillus kexueae]
MENSFQPSQSMNNQAGQMQPPLNHGGHEMFDAHEILATFINVLDQYVIFDQYIQDPELKQILKHQQQFITDLYNISVQTFSTGQKPDHSQTVYNMDQSNDVVYGMKPSQPKKPNTSIQEVSDQGLSAYMLGLIKSTASLLAMTSLEITNPVFRRVISDSVPNFIEMGYEIFLYQNKRGYYQVPQLQPQDMTAMMSSFVEVPVSPNPNQEIH